MLKDINSLSYKQYEIDKKTGHLKDTGTTNEKGSKEYSKSIDAGIENHDSTIHVQMAPSGNGTLPNGQNASVAGHHGGVTYSLSKDRSNIYVFITGKGGNRDYTWFGIKVGIPFPAPNVLMHEIVGHAVPQQTGKQDNLNANQLEDLVNNELGLMPAPNDPNHKVRY